MANSAPGLVLPALAIALAAAVSSCSCTEKPNSHSPVSSASSAAPVGPGPAPAPAPAASPGTVADTASDASPNVPDPAVGDEVRPITGDTVTTIDTSKAAALKHLIFTANDTQESGRYLTEYLLVVTAHENSCVRLKTRPTAGLSDKVGDTATAGGPIGSEACSATDTTGDTGSGSGTGSATTSGSGSTSLALVEERPALAALKGITVEKAPAGLSLAGTAATCSTRLFRMESDATGSQSGTLGTVVSKTGRLLVIGSKVRIWLDEEYANPCTGGSTLDARSAVSYGPLVQDNGLPATVVTKLWELHLQNLATEMDRILTAMTGTYGDVSDVDGTGFVEVFVSPDVNRRYFVKFLTSRMDDFRSELIYRPQDLAYYDATKNPLSNEGEILYLWTPDPGGIYSYGQYPSANSLTSNYAKGYLSSQLMTLIFANQRLLKQALPTISDPWLLQSLALLGASYYAGNDFPLLSLAQYLTARPQNISLTGDPYAISEGYKGMAGDESLGMRAVFAWYLHTKLCSTGVDPCAKLKDLIVSTKSGTEAVAEILGEDFGKVFENFALSVGVSLVDHPDVALAPWSKDPLPDGLPEKPLTLPDLAEISPASPPQTEEEDAAAAMLTSDQTDRSVAGPFPSKKNLIFQPLTPDSDLEFKVAKDSVTFVLVTGLVDTQTDVTALFGKGLSATFIPVGERDTTLRKIHFEKLSESAQRDLRPENLTKVKDPLKTYYSDPIYDTEDYAVTQARELWILGSVDNYIENVDGAKKTISDADVFEIQISPCDGLSGTELTDCEAKDFKVLLQTSVRAFEKELQPMMVLTDTSRTIFRGASVHGLGLDLKPDLVEAAQSKTYVCAAAGDTITPQSVTFTAGAPGKVNLAGHNLAATQTVVFSSSGGPLPIGVLPLVEYTVTAPTTNDFQLLDTSNQLVTISLPTYALTGTFSVRAAKLTDCADGGFLGAHIFSNDLTAQDPKAFAHTWQNYLMAGPFGFPYTTRGTYAIKDLPACDGERCYYAEESNHQHFFFGFDKGLKATTNYYRPGPSAFDFPENLSEAPTFVPNTDLVKLLGLKTEMDTCAIASRTADTAFMDSCTAVADLTAAVCDKICAQSNPANVAAFEALIDAFFANKVASCTGTGCLTASKLAGAGTYSHAWLPATHIYFMNAAKVTETSFYAPIQPATQHTYCSGWPGFKTTSFERCLVRSASAATISDIRQQLALPTSKIATFPSFSSALGTDFKAAFDFPSTYTELLGFKEYAFKVATISLETDRDRLWPVPVGSTRPVPPGQIYKRAGEVIGKPERLHEIHFTVPGTGQILNVIIGGRHDSQGKYLLRARIADYLDAN